MNDSSKMAIAVGTGVLVQKLLPQAWWMYLLGAGAFIILQEPGLRSSLRAKAENIYRRG
jgi:hypothetical protein